MENFFKKIAEAVAPKQMASFEARKKTERDRALDLMQKQQHQTMIEITNGMMRNKLPDDVKSGRITAGQVWAVIDKQAQ